MYEIDDYYQDYDELTEEEEQEARSAADAIIAAEFDSIYARQAWEATQTMQEGDGFLHLT
jgi:hypothetical protein